MLASFRMSAQCAICGGQPAARHFGGMSCRSCKGFFRRCLKLNRKYVCSLGNSCVISKTSRFYCRACRWRQCLEAGMNAMLVHSDRSIDTCKRPRKPSTSEVSGELVPYDPRSAGSSTSSSSTFWDVDLNETNLCSAMIESSRRTMPNYGPLGVRNLLRPFNPSHPPSVVHYLLEVDRLLDNFDEEYLHLEHCSQRDLNQPLEVAFLFEPRRLTNRTKLIWEPLRVPTLDNFASIFTRQILHYADAISFYPEFWTLDFEDQLKLAVGRCIPCGPLAIASRAVKVPGKKCLLLPGGFYFLLEEDEEDDRKKFGTIDLAEEFTYDYGHFVYNNVVEPARNLRVSEAEFVLLKAICFFQPLPKLSPRGRKIVLAAQSSYTSLLAELLQATCVDKMAALKRLSSLLALLPPGEQVTQIEMAYMLKITLFNVGKVDSVLSNQLYVQRRLQ